MGGFEAQILFERAMYVVCIIYAIVIVAIING